MLNISLLRSGMINRDLNLNSTKNTRVEKDKKLDYFRLSNGFKDAHNSFLRNISKTYKKKDTYYNPCVLI